MPAAENLRKKYNRTRGKEVLRYPLKMFAEGTDYLQIDMLNYAPVAERDERREVKDGIEKYKSYVKDPKEGFRRNSNKQPLGTILLPIPSNIQDGNSVNYTDDSMNNVVGAALGGVEGLMRGIGETVATDTFNLEKYGSVTNEQFKGFLSSSGLNIANAQDLATKYLAAQATSIFGGNVTLSQILARQSGQIFNPNMELLFNGPSLRNFTFSFKMTPRSADESDEIKTIIRFFKRGMSPKAGETALFLKTPNVFELRYRQGNEEHKFLNKFKQCFLENISVNYTGDGVYSTYNDGTPVSMVMTLMFKELAPIYDIDYDSEDSGVGVGY
jgi:hypothetical protein